MDGHADLDPVDREALERAMAIAMQRDPLSAEHLASKLKDEPWREVAEFAAYSCQIESLSLKPWQDPPVSIDEDATSLTRSRHCDGSTSVGGEARLARARRRNDQLNAGHGIANSRRGVYMSVGPRVQG
jgi:hypothetical protein